MYKKYLGIVFLCASSCSHADVLKNSIIDTRDGQKLAIEVRKGNVLESIEKDKKRLAQVIVSDTITSKTNTIFEIQLEGKTIQAVQDQTFFDPMINRWIKAKNLTVNNHLLGSDSKHIPVLGTVKRTGEFETVKIMVDGSHYFFADGVLTHNFWQAVLAFIVQAIGNSVIDKAVEKTGEKLTGSKDTGKAPDVHNHHHVHHTTNNYTTNNHPANHKPVRTFNQPPHSGVRGK